MVEGDELRKLSTPGLYSMTGLKCGVGRDSDKDPEPIEEERIKHLHVRPR